MIAAPTVEDVLTVIPLVLAGMLTGLSLIVVIGAQNAFLLKVGITGDRGAIATVVAVCLVSDVVLIAAGTAGVGALIRQAPMLLLALRFLGSAFLIVYGGLAVRRALRPTALEVAGSAEPEARAASARAGVLTAVHRPRLRSLLVTALALTWLNPHVYLDTVVLLGSLANQQPVDLRWWWAGGAMLGSAVWFSALGFGGRALRPLLRRQRVWRAIDVGIAVVMIGFGLKLALLG